KVSGPSTLPLLRSELDVARFSGWTGRLSTPPSSVMPAAAEVGTGRLEVITEGGIRSALLGKLQAAERGDNIDLAMFYIADRGIIQSLLAASRRGVNVRLILDPNKDSFGHARNGIPNQPAASDLVTASDGAIHVRWYRTHGEQFHTKLVMIY